MYEGHSQNCRAPHQSKVFATPLASPKFVSLRTDYEGFNTTGKRQPLSRRAAATLESGVGASGRFNGLEVTRVILTLRVRASQI